MRKTKRTKLTRKVGGNINNQSGLDKILSIGYEVECTNLVKLTETQEFRPTYVLYNSDSARKDMEEFKKLEEYEMYDDDDNEESEEVERGSKEEAEEDADEADEDADEAEEDADNNGDNADADDDADEDADEAEEDADDNGDNEDADDEEAETSKSSTEDDTKAETSKSSIDADIYERNEEQPTAKIYKFDERGEPTGEYPDAVFNITNDIAKPKFNRTLNTLCKSLDKDHPENKFPASVKDKLYKYRCSEKEKTYDIHFKFKEETAQKCSNFTNVEWVVTYYKPSRSNNVIIDTYVNMLQNITKHLENIVPIPGDIIFKNPSTNKEKVVPGKHILYRKNKRTYYLQTDQVNGDTPIDNVCAKTQMTFSAKAEDIIDVMLNIIKDYTGYSDTVPEVKSQLENYMDIIKKIKKCVDALYDSFTVSKGLTKEEKMKLRNKKTQIKQLKTYMFLILFKLNRFYYFIFYNDLVKVEKKRSYNYLKDLLFFNSRHVNYVLYLGLKDKIKEILGEVDAVRIVKELFMQSSILSEYLIEDEFKEDEYKDLIDVDVIFSKDTVIDKENDVYGDPTFSLNSYFDFFENPVQNEKNTKRNGKIKYYDWLEYADHDVFSANMDLKEDVVLLECRIFQDILSAYFYHIGDAMLKEQMTNGACNKIAGKEGTVNITAFSIGNFKNIIKMPESSFKGGISFKGGKSFNNKKKKITRKHKNLTKKARKR